MRRIVIFSVVLMLVAGIAGLVFWRVPAVQTWVFKQAGLCC